MSADAFQQQQQQQQIGAWYSVRALLPLPFVFRVSPLLFFKGAHRQLRRSLCLYAKLVFYKFFVFTLDSGGERQKSHGTVQQKDTQKQPNMVVCNGAPISLRPRRGRRRRRRRRRRRTSLVCARQFAVAGQQQYNNSRITASLPPPSPVQSKKNKTHSLASPRLESGLVCGSLRTRPPFFLLFCFLPSFFFFKLFIFIIFASLFPNKQTPHHSPRHRRTT